MPLSRKYYQEIAKTLCYTDAPDRVIEGLMDYFKHDNPRFNAVRFRKAIRTCKR